ncbi:MAG: S1C family serine protease [Rickettsiales bacterium]
MIHRFFALATLLVVIFPFFPAFSQNVKMFVNSGTGFIVSRSGHIITNLHVVDFCERITVRGAVTPRVAKIVGRDVRHDLALLKINPTGSKLGSFRDVSLPVEKGERAVVVGYPGRAGMTGKTVTREAEITNTKGPQGEDTWVQLSDLVEQGNSGGPLMDASGNVIGVVAAKAVIYSYKQSDPKNGTFTNSGIAIATPVVKQFLDRYRVPYYHSKEARPLSSSQLTSKAKRFVVNVHCESSTEVR